MSEINDHDFEIIKSKCKAGDLLAERGKYKEAVAEYNIAYSLIPEPKSDYEATTWVLTAIGDVCFLGKFYKSAYEAFEYAIQCNGALGNPFIHLRLGQLEFERGNKAKALDELVRAYMGAGFEIFENEDAKYFDFLESNIEPPASGKW